MISQMKLFAVYASLLSFILIGSHATNILNHQCNLSSCGSLRNISFPFRLDTDPRNCGHPEFTLSCENNQTVIYLDTAKHYVLSINYHSWTIRVVDAYLEKDNCSSLPRRSSQFSYNNYLRNDDMYYSKSLLFIECQDKVLNSSLYIDTYPCINGTYSSDYSYVKIGPTHVTDLEDSCRIELMAVASFMPEDFSNISYMDIHHIMASGFELFWGFSVCCDDNGKNHCGDNATYQKICDDGGIGLTLQRDARWMFGSLLHIYYSYYFNETVVEKYKISFGERISSLFGDASYLLKDLQRVHGAKKILYAHYYALALSPYLIVSIVVFRALIIICGSLGVFFLLISKWRRRHLSMYDGIEEFLQKHDNLVPVRYSYSNIKKITNKFKDKLGEGGFGCVYKGKLRSGQLAAIKMLGTSKTNGQDFINEVATIGRIYHVNVVRLIGYCVEGSKRALVYEFMPNGSLEKYLFEKEGTNHISIKSMYEIAIGVARGIEYLHEGCNMQILHFDIKPHNILLDEKFNPKISDFGLAKLYPTGNNIVSLTAARGTMGYMAPELFYRNIGGISHKADVYSFGVLLMEMVGRRKNLNACAEHSSQIYFPSWAYEQVKIGSDMDLGAVSDEERSIIKKMVVVGLWCMQLHPVSRPSMHKAIEMLEGEVESLEIPPKPLLSLDDKAKEKSNININIV